jgi:leucyl-tRNA synthetase
VWADFVKLLAPYAPHLGEELWAKLGNKDTITYVAWPTFDEKLCVDNSCTVVVQVNGKIRDKFEAAVGTDKATLEKTALASAGAVKFMEGKAPKKVIVVQDKLVNIVV